MNFFVVEVLIGGLLTGVLYSLVALGFVLIFKASGVFNFAQGAMCLFAALALVRLMEAMPQGSMLAVPLAESEAKLLLDGSLSLAAVNAPYMSVLAGPAGVVQVVADDPAEFSRRLAAAAAGKAAAGLRDRQPDYF